jgi:phosphomannomutase
MLRASGTEPVLRIYAESSSEQRVQSLLDLGRKLLKAGGG